MIDISVSSLKFFLIGSIVFILLCLLFLVFGKAKRPERIGLNKNRELMIKYRNDGSLFDIRIVKSGTDSYVIDGAHITFHLNNNPAVIRYAKDGDLSSYGSVQMHEDGYVLITKHCIDSGSFLIRVYDSQGKILRSENKERKQWSGRAPGQSGKGRR